MYGDLGARGSVIFLANTALVDTTVRFAYYWYLSRRTLIRSIANGSIENLYFFFVLVEFGHVETLPTNA